VDKNRGRPRLTWMNEVTEWIGFKMHEKIKRTAEDRDKWRAIVIIILKENNK